MRVHTGERPVEVTLSNIAFANAAYAVAAALGYDVSIALCTYM